MADDQESGQIWLSKSLLGPLLNTEDVARDFAALILKRLNGDAELAKQQPLRVFDQGTDWVIMGSYHEAGKRPGAGAWFIRVRKSDCRVDQFGHYDPLEIPDEVKAILGREIW